MNTPMNTPIYEITLTGWILLAMLLLPQSIFLFIDARKRGAWYWLWGIWGMFSFPLPLLLYLIIVRKIFKRKRKE